MKRLINNASAQTVQRDGSVPMTGNLNMDSNKLRQNGDANRLVFERLSLERRVSRRQRQNVGCQHWIS